MPGAEAALERAIHEQAVALAAELGQDVTSTERNLRRVLSHMLRRVAAGTSWAELVDEKVAEAAACGL
jgi:hypothetical protein